MRALPHVTILTGLLLALPFMAPAQAAPAPAPELAAVNAADAAYWNAYNGCDFAALDKLTANDVEFYHDLGGVTLGRDRLTDSVRKNICGKPGVKIRRDAVAASVRTSLLSQGGKVYGAIVAGEHLFYQNQATQASDHARFTQLWLLNGNAWQLKRVLSYDHAPVAYVNKRKAISLPAAALDRVTGTYTSKLQPQFVIVRAGANLSVDVNGKPSILYPLDQRTFFVKEQDITVEFKPDNGVPRSFIVRMNGVPLDEAQRK